MTGKQIIVNAIPGEIRLAVLDDGRLVDLVIDRMARRGTVGDIYLGRVVRVLPAIEAAFVDIGLAEAGYLGLNDARPAGGTGEKTDRITDYAAQGDAVLVQVLRDPWQGKSAKLTARPVLTGRYAVYLPGQRGITVSRRIIEPEERRRLAAVAAEIAGDGEDGGAIILRTNAQGTAADLIRGEILGLKNAWAEILAGRADGQPPDCLAAEIDPLCRMLRDEAGAALDAVIIDDAGTEVRAREFCRKFLPGVEDLIARHGEIGPVFEHFAVEEQIEAALSPEVALPSGGNLVIEETAALTAIDVNTGGGNRGQGMAETARQTNVEAAREIARQLRLRNLGGQIVVDFVSTRDDGDRDRLAEFLRECLKSDGGETQVFGFTRLGLVELTRRRRRQTLAETLLSRRAGRVEKSPESAAFDLVRAVMTAAARAPGRGLRVAASPAVMAALGTVAQDARKHAETKLGNMVTWTEDSGLRADRFDIAAAPQAGDAKNG